jgi:hypothetical protein
MRHEWSCFSGGNIITLADTKGPNMHVAAFGRSEVDIVAPRILGHYSLADGTLHFFHGLAGR